MIALMFLSVLDISRYFFSISDASFNDFDANDFDVSCQNQYLMLAINDSRVWGFTVQLSFISAF